MFHHASGFIRQNGVSRTQLNLLNETNLIWVVYRIFLYHTDIFEGLYFNIGLKLISYDFDWSSYKASRVFFTESLSKWTTVCYVTTPTNRRSSSAQYHLQRAFNTWHPPEPASTIVTSCMTSFWAKPRAIVRGQWWCSNLCLMSLHEGASWNREVDYSYSNDHQWPTRHSDQGCGVLTWYVYFEFVKPDKTINLFQFAF